MAAWVADSGASHHMYNVRSSFIIFKKLRSPIHIKLGNDSVVIATFHGLISLAGTGGYELDALYMAR